MTPYTRWSAIHPCVFVLSASGYTACRVVGISSIGPSNDVLSPLRAAPAEGWGSTQYFFRSNGYVGSWILELWRRRYHDAKSGVTPLTNSSAKARRTLAAPSSHENETTSIGCAALDGQH